MARYVFLCMVNAADGRDDELNTWLDEVHIPEFVAAGGFSGCRRYELASEMADSPGALKRYMHIYELETDDLDKTRHALLANRHLRTPTSSAMDLSDAFSVYYRAR